MPRVQTPGCACDGSLVKASTATLACRAMGATAAVSAEVSGPRIRPTPSATAARAAVAAPSGVPAVSFTSSWGRLVHPSRAGLPEAWADRSRRAGRTMAAGSRHVGHLVQRPGARHLAARCPTPQADRHTRHRCRTGPHRTRRAILCREGARMPDEACATSPDPSQERTSALPNGLVLVSTPIGNLGDLSPRARAALCAADLILCEDTRHSARLLAARSA